MLLLAVLLTLGAQDPLDACADVGGHLETVACYGEARERIEAEQGTILARINRSLDGLTTEYGAEPETAKRSLADAQTRWKAFVDADCAVGEALFGDGNAFALDALDCEIAHFEDRNRQLLALEARYLAN